MGISFGVPCPTPYTPQCSHNPSFLNVAAPQIHKAQFQGPSPLWRAAPTWAQPWWLPLTLYAGLRGRLHSLSTTWPFSVSFLGFITVSPPDNTPVFSVLFPVSLNRCEHSAGQGGLPAAQVDALWSLGRWPFPSAPPPSAGGFRSVASCSETAVTAPAILSASQAKEGSRGEGQEGPS